MTESGDIGSKVRAVSFMERPWDSICVETNSDKTLEPCQNRKKTIRLRES